MYNILVITRYFFLLKRYIFQNGNVFSLCQETKNTAFDMVAAICWHTELSVTALF